LKTCQEGLNNPAIERPIPIAVNTIALTIIEALNGEEDIF